MTMTEIFARTTSLPLFAAEFIAAPSDWKPLSMRLKESVPVVKTSPPLLRAGGAGGQRCADPGSAAMVNMPAAAPGDQRAPGDGVGERMRFLHRVLPDWAVRLMMPRSIFLDKPCKPVAKFLSKN